MKISIVIPAYNEEKRIQKCLIEIDLFCKKRFEDYELIVVDDGSKDKTNEKAKQLKNKKIKILKNTQNKGKGYSVKRGMLKSKYPLILFSDADLATPIEELPPMIEWINKGYDLIIASRNMKGSNIVAKQPFYRQIAGKMFALFVRIFAVQGFKDTQCGFKLFKEEAGKKIAKLQTIERFSFDVEMLIIAKKLGFKIKEVPVKWTNDINSKVNLKKDVFKMFKDIIKIRINYLKEKYN